MNQKRAQLIQIKGNTYAAKGDTNHWVIMDTKSMAGGHGAGASPKEFLLFAIGGCTSSDVISILNKKRAAIKHYELFVRATEREEHPKIFTEIHIEYVFYGDNLNPDDIKKAIDLSVTKYCSVSAMIQPTVKLTHSYRIEPADRIPTTVEIS
jgi:putative redox protein